ncbi:MAG: LVIVD repeat-containing protein [Candidatus Hodarchaeota archaeon]
MDKAKRNQLAWMLVLGLLVFFFLNLGPTNLPTVRAASHFYSEDFTSINYQDDVMTNASGWGFGSLQLPYKHPKLLGIQDTPGWAFQLSLQGQLALVADGDAGIHIYDVQNPAFPVFVSTYDTPGYARDVKVQGNVAYVADGPSGLLAINIANPSALSLRDVFNTNGWAWAVAIQSNIAVVADGNAGISVVNITNPDNLNRYDEALGSGISLDVFIDGTFAYVADGDQGLRVVDISNPENVIEKGQYISSDIVEGIFVEGNYGYLAVAEAGLEIIDVSNPDVLQFVGSYNTPGWAHDVVVSGDFAYVADDSRGLTVVDVSNKADPTYGPFSQIPDKACGVTLSALTCYIADEKGGFLAFDIEDLITYSYPAIGQSRNVFFGLTTRRFTTAYLTATTSIPAQTQVTFQISADGGLHWETIIPDTLHSIAYTGNSLKWRVIFQTTDNTTTPELFSLSIAYDSVLVYPDTIYPDDNELIWSPSVPLYWEPVEGAQYYIVQIDNTTSFNSPFLVNISTTLTNYWYGWQGEGIWYWRVATVDNTNARGFFSPTIGFRHDVYPPRAPTIISPEIDLVTNETPTFSWIAVPEAETYILEFSSYVISFGHPNFTFSGIQETSYTPDWNFSIVAEYGYWDWRVSGVDEYYRKGDPSYGSFLIDKWPPYIELQGWYPHREICQDDDFTFTLVGWDDSRFIEWTVSDPITFELSVEDTGWESVCTITKVNLLSPGDHNFTVFATDEFGYTSTYSFLVEVGRCIRIPGFPPETIILGLVAALLPVIVIRYRRQKATNRKILHS